MIGGKVAVHPALPILQLASRFRPCHYGAAERVHFGKLERGQLTAQFEPFVGAMSHARLRVIESWQRPHEQPVGCRYGASCQNPSHYAAALVFL